MSDAAQFSADDQFSEPLSDQQITTTASDDLIKFNKARRTADGGGQFANESNQITRHVGGVDKAKRRPPDQRNIYQSEVTTTANNEQLWQECVESDAEREIRKIFGELDAVQKLKLPTSATRCESIPLMDDLIEDLILFSKQFEHETHSKWQATPASRQQHVAPSDEKLLYINNAAGLRVVCPIVVSTQT